MDLRVPSIPKLQQILAGDGGRWLRDDDMELVAQLLEVTCRTQQADVRREPTFASYRRLLQMLADAKVPLALELQERLRS